MGSKGIYSYTNANTDSELVESHKNNCVLCLPGWVCLQRKLSQLARTERPVPHVALRKVTAGVTDGTTTHTPPV